MELTLSIKNVYCLKIEVFCYVTACRLQCPCLQDQAVQEERTSLLDAEADITVVMIIRVEWNCVLPAVHKSAYNQFMKIKSQPLISHLLKSEGTRSVQ
jgi:hypothetical protein